MKIIDLRSDTVTEPTQAMREAMFRAEVGDDVYRDDPTMNAFERDAARILGKQAALFVSSGTMGNQLAIMSQTSRGDEIIVGAASHIFEHEVGAVAVLSGANQRQIPFENGIPDARSIERAIRPAGDIHLPETRLICLENALAGGRVVPLSTMREIYAMAKRRGIAVHLDGARVFNAAVALGVEVTELTACCDTLSCCLSKGLCAPVGALLAGPADVIERARKYRKLLGGGMRQVGFLAAAGRIALTEMTRRLHVDHKNARRLAEALMALPGVTLDPDAVEINMVFFHLDRDRDFLDKLPGLMLAEGIKMNGHEEGVFRFVTSNDVTEADVDRVVDVLGRLIG